MTIELIDHQTALAELMKDPEFEIEYTRRKVYTELALEIYRLRKELKLSQVGLAEKAGTSQNIISKIESGGHNARISTVISIAEALDSKVEIKLVKNEKFDSFFSEASEIFPINFEGLRSIRIKVAAAGAQPVLTSTPVIEYADRAD